LFLCFGKRANRDFDLPRRLRSGPTTQQEGKPPKKKRRKKKKEKNAEDNLLFLVLVSHDGTPNKNRKMVENGFTGFFFFFIFLLIFKEKIIYC
jgi:hypothetical protein